MVAIQVRDVSDETRDALAAEAERRGQSLQFFLADVLEREASSARNLAWVKKMRARPRSQSGGPSSRELIEQGRRERDLAIFEALGVPELIEFE